MTILAQKFDYYLTLCSHLPKPTLLFLLAVDDFQSLISLWYSLRQNLMPIFSNKKVVFDPDTTNWIVLM